MIRDMDIIHRHHVLIEGNILILNPKLFTTITKAAKVYEQAIREGHRFLFASDSVLYFEMKQGEQTGDGG